tara:strand:+ start:10133 stop:10423 length:291 start_codon:yes stop_codon:yes gene_type:complete
MSQVSAILIQGNQKLFNKCEYYLADKKYDGNILNCFRTERNLEKKELPDFDSTINKQQSSLWNNADGSVSGFEIDHKKINLFVAIGAIVGIFILVK